MESLYSPEQNKLKVVEAVGIKEVGNLLLNSVPGMVVLDLDFTLKPEEYELGMGGKEPGRLPDESMELLRQLKSRGWKTLVVTNQPIEGHQVARAVRKVKGANYPIFPNDVVNELGKENVLGAGLDFLISKFKKSAIAIEKTSDWIGRNGNGVDGQLVFVGDRDGDVEFAQKVADKSGRDSLSKRIFYKVKGLSLPGPFKKLERFIP